jgi:hypothetical protein
METVMAKAKKSSTTTVPATERYYVRWLKVRPAGTTNYGEICSDLQDARDFVRALIASFRGDGVVYTDHQQRDVGKWLTVETEAYAGIPIDPDVERRARETDEEYERRFREAPL